MSVGTEEMGRTRVFFRMTHGSLFAECVRGSHMLRKMRKDELSGGCISFVVAAVHVPVQNLKIRLVVLQRALQTKAVVRLKRF